MYFYVYIIFIVISFLAGITVYFQRDVKLYLRLFPVFLLLTIIVELIAAYYMRIYKSYPTTLYSLFTSFEFLFYAYVLKEIINNRRMKKIFFYVAGLYLTLVILNFLFVQKTSSFTSVTYVLGSVFIVAGSIYYFYEQFQLPQSVNLARQPAFWICSGLLFYYCCGFPVYGPWNFLKSVPYFIQKNLYVFVVLLNVFLYSSFTIAFLCRLRIRKSTS